MTAPVDCLALFKNDYIELGHGKPRAPKGIPPELKDEYTKGGRIQLIKAYNSDIYLGQTKSIIVWSVRNVDNLIRLDKEGKLGGTYGAKQTNTLRDALKHTPEIINARVLVIGTTTPRV